MKSFQTILIAGACLIFLGTTYVVKEGGREVGRFEENDGKNETVELSNAAPRNPAAPAQPQFPKELMTPPAKPFSPDNLPTNRFKQAEEALKMAIEAKKANEMRKAEVEKAVAEMEGY